MLKKKINAEGQTAREEEEYGCEDPGAIHMSTYIHVWVLTTFH